MAEIASQPGRVRDELEPEPIVRIDAVRKAYGGTVALDGVSLTIAHGEMFALLGASGSGKTTLLRLIAGFEEPDAGSIVVDGRDMAGVPAYERPVNIMFQSYALFPHMSAAANVAFGLKHEAGPRLSKAEIRDRTRAALALARLEGLEARRPHELSGGEQQRVALARAIVKRPKVLLLDEPLAALDRKLRESTQLELVRVQAETGITFVIVTHDQDEAMSLSDRMAVLHLGTIAQVGPPKAIYERPESVYVADFIGAANLVSGTVLALDSLGAIVRSPELGCDVDVADLPPGIAVGDTLHVAVRPERIVVTTVRSDDPEHNVVRAKIKDVAFLGNQSRLALALPSGKLMTAVRLNPGSPGHTRGAMRRTRDAAADEGGAGGEPQALEPDADVYLVFAARDCRGLKA